MPQIPPNPNKPNPIDDTNDVDHYDAFSALVRRAYALAEGPVYETLVTEGLFDNTWLPALPEARRQIYKCNCCRQFINRYGRLVTLKPNGDQVSILGSILEGPTPPAFFVDAVKAVKKAVEDAVIHQPFVTSERAWGTPSTGMWKHLAVIPHPSMVSNRHDRPAHEIREEAKMLHHALMDYTEHHAEEAVRILENGNLFQPEKAIGIARWFLKIRKELNSIKNPRRESNMLWREVATAPVGYAHVRSSMIGTLLDDIKAGTPFDDLKDKWNAKMDPMHYMRAQVAPKAGNIRAAEIKIREMGFETALERRYANLGDITALWRPKAPVVVPPREGVFKDVVPRTPPPGSLPGAKSLVLPRIAITWVKFRDTVLSDMVKLEALLPLRGSFITFTTAVHEDAAPIYKWDSAKNPGPGIYEAYPEIPRNPTSWYLYDGGSTAVQYGLPSNSPWHEVSAVTLLPCMWREDNWLPPMGKGVVLLLKGARDTNNPGLAIFPDHLIRDLRDIRATIEAFSTTRKLEGQDKAEATGLDLRHGSNWGVPVRVTDAKGHTQEYLLERWD